MIFNFPTICVDDFYKNPDQIRQFALNLEYNNKDNATGDYPGKRTELLHLTHPNFFNTFCQKLFSIYFDFQTPVDWKISTSFQLIDSLSSSPTDSKNVGWIHKDDILFGGIIYLTPNINPSCGTSIFKKINDISIEESDKIHDVKKSLYRDGIDAGHDRAIETNNRNFIQTAKFDNIYNRLVAFDGNCYHGVNSFYSDVPRLTQTFFVESVTTSGGLPLQRCYKSDL